MKAAAASTAELMPLIQRVERDGSLRQVLALWHNLAKKEGFGRNGLRVLCDLQGMLSEKRLRWAFGMLLSRLVRLPARREEEALCPWADMLNHDCRATTHLDFDPGSRTAYLETDRSYQAGEQVNGNSQTARSYDHRIIIAAILSKKLRERCLV